jgi:hypothetical protein
MLLEEKDYYSAHAGVKQRAIFGRGRAFTGICLKSTKAEKQTLISRKKGNNRPAFLESFT